MSRLSNHILVLPIFFFTFATSAEDACGAMEIDGQAPVPFRISLYDLKANPIEDARVRIVRTNHKGDESEESWNTYVVVKTYETRTNKEGVARLSPILPVNEFRPTEQSSCRGYKGFVDLDFYLIVEKQGFHTLNIELSRLALKRSFDSSEKLKASLVFQMLTNDI